MAGFSLIELRSNDDLIDVVKKVNTNFRNLSYATRQNMIASSNEGVDAWQKALAELAAEFDGKITELTNSIDAAKKTMSKMIPPIGSYFIMSPTTKTKTPSDMWPNTVWETVEGNLVLTSSTKSDSTTVSSAEEDVTVKTATTTNTANGVGLLLYKRIK